MAMRGGVEVPPLVVAWALARGSHALPSKTRVKT